VAVSNIGLLKKAGTGEETIRILMADLGAQEVRSFLAGLAEDWSPQQGVREVEVFNTYVPEGDEVVHQEQEIDLGLGDGSHRHISLSRRSGHDLLPPMRKVLERKVEQPPQMAPVRNRQSIESLELKLQREATVAYEASGFRSSWFDGV
jgi:hypothetical protein